MTGSEENLPLDMKSVDRHLGSFVPSARLRRWLLIGISALVVDLVLGVASTVLEFQHWGEEGVTTDVILMLVAIIPQCFVAATYLVLACESQCRGLWKSTAGMLGSYLLLCVYGVVLLEVLQDSGNVAIMVLVAVGLVGLFAFSVSGIPRFGADDADCVSKKNMSGKQSDSPQGLGWIGGVAMFLVFVVLRLLFRRFAQPAFRGGLDIDNWQLIELLAVIVFGLSFAVWFAVTKFRHRRTLGRMASVTGWTEIVILLIHAGLAVTIFAVLINEAAANPLLDDDGVDQLLEPWIKRASLVSSVSHALWCVLTAMFFASTRGRVCQLPEWSRRCLEAD